jgi:hypothetical protein
MGVDVPTTLLMLVVFALLGLGIFIFIEWLFQKIIRKPIATTRTLVFLTFVLTPSLILLVFLFVIIPGQNSYTESTRKYLQQEDSLARRADSLHRAATIPPGIKLDTVIHFDSTTNAEILMQIPKCGIPAIDEQVTAEFVKRQQKFLSFIRSSVERDSSFFEFGSTLSVELVFAHRDPTVISYLLMVSFYHPYAEIAMPRYLSLNFDVAKNKRLTFKDYFNLPTKRDSSFLEEQIMNAIRIDGIKLPKMNEIDFAIASDSVWFNLQDYEMDSFFGTVTHSKVPKRNIVANIHSQYRQKN